MGTRYIPDELEQQLSEIAVDASVARRKPTNESAVMRVLLEKVLAEYGKTWDIEWLADGLDSQK